MLTQEALKVRLKYDPETGVFTWLISPSSQVPTGRRAGSIMQNGYRSVAIDRKRYYAHRLAWLYVYGTFPHKGIDHRDLDKDNNRIENLREADQSQNLANSRARNVSGIKGVKRTPAGRWKAFITDKKKCIHLGTFETSEEASLAYAEAARELFGEFARA